MVHVVHPALEAPKDKKELISGCAKHPALDKEKEEMSLKARLLLLDNIKSASQDVKQTRPPLVRVFPGGESVF